MNEMLDAGAVTKAAELGVAAMNVEGKITPQTVGGEEVVFSSMEMRPLTPLKHPTPDTLIVYTLDALEGYLRSNRDALKLEDLIVHVQSPTLVRVLGPFEGYHKVRPCYLEANAQLPTFPWGTYLDVETAIVNLQSMFLDAEDRDPLIGLLGNVTAEEAARNTDDGMSQEVSVRKGVVMQERTKVDNPVTLAPFRTFLTVPQPQSQFVVRFKNMGDEARVALFEGDGGAWKITAVDAVVSRLGEMLEGTGVEVIG